MKFHVARQPIFNRKLKVYGYELLYRQADTDNFYNPQTHIGGDEATSNVIVNSFYNIGINDMTAGRRAFINFTGNLLVQEIATLLPNDKLVVEVLEDVQATPVILERCRQLKDMGYEIALDDFVLSKENEALCDLADIIKIDFMQTSIPVIDQMMRRTRRPGLRFLAEKIETREIYDKAMNMGFSYFQGYFFSKPLIISGEDVRPLPVNCVKLIQMVNYSEIDFRQVGRIIMRDVSLTYQLLKLVNSAAFGFRGRIKTVHHALVALGSNEVRKWVSLVSMMGINKSNPRELNRISIIRAKFCEGMASYVTPSDPNSLFMTGLFSLMDVIMGRTFDTIFRDIGVSEETQDALLEGTGPHAIPLKLAVAYERGEWEEVDRIAQQQGISVDVLGDIYQNAVHWCSSMLGDEYVE